MPLLDHFHPPLSGRRQWESFHSAWAEALALQLNRDLLPPRFFAEVHVKVGSRVEIDVGTFEENGVAGRGRRGAASQSGRRRARCLICRSPSLIPTSLRSRS